MTIQQMTTAFWKIINGNFGYSMANRWTGFNRTTGTINSSGYFDCSSFCGALAQIGGYKPNLSDFSTRSAKAELTARGFTAMAFTSSSQLREGDMLLGNTHIEYCPSPGRIGGARTDGVAWNQQVTESSYYLHSNGWHTILRPPADTSLTGGKEVEHIVHSYTQTETLPKGQDVLLKNAKGDACNLGILNKVGVLSGPVYIRASGLGAYGILKIRVLVQKAATGAASPAWQEELVADKDGNCRRMHNFSQMINSGERLLVGLNAPNGGKLESWGGKINRFIA